MAEDHSFDIVSKVDFQEVANAVQTTLKEIRNRFDYKHSRADILQEKEKLTLIADDDFKLKGLKDVLEEKMARRRIPLRAVLFQKIEDGPNRTVKQEVHFQVGIPQEKARDIVKLIKQAKFKAQASIQGEHVRVSSSKIDVLQEIMAFLKSQNLGIHMQFDNYR
jgi:uncharacterized protein YajQ (UPF0234 family)